MWFLSYATAFRQKGTLITITPTSGKVTIVCNAIFLTLTVGSRECKYRVKFAYIFFCN